MFQKVDLTIPESIKSLHYVQDIRCYENLRDDNLRLFWTQWEEIPSDKITEGSIKSVGHVIIMTPEVILMDLFEEVFLSKIKSIGNEPRIDCDQFLGTPAGMIIYKFEEKE